MLIILSDQTQEYQSQNNTQHRQAAANKIPSTAFPCNMNLITPGISVSSMGRIHPSPSPRITKRTLPHYLRPLPPKFQGADIDYLETKGALTIPESGLRNELLRSYIKWVHAYMPLLELDEFLTKIFANDGSQQLSLLLFQAVMFAGTAFIDMKHLHAAGFSTRKAARKAFFQRARVCDDEYQLFRSRRAALFYSGTN